MRNRIITIVAVLLLVPIFAISATLTTRFGDDTHDGKLKIADGSQNYVNIDTQALSADWTFSFPTADGSANQFLETDGSGNASWAAIDIATGDVTGILPAANGGTGAASLAATTVFNQLLYSVREASAAHDGATAAETAVAPAAADGSATIAVAQLKAGAAFDWQAFVVATGDADGDETLTVNVYFGAQLVGTTGAIAVDGPIEFLVTGDVRVRTAGAGGTGIYQCVAYNGASTVAMDGATFSSFDTTATKAFTIKLDWGGTTDAADSATVEDATLYVANFD